MVIDRERFDFHLLDNLSHGVLFETSGLVWRTAGEVGWFDVVVVG